MKRKEKTAGLLESSQILVLWLKVPSRVHSTAGICEQNLIEWDFTAIRNETLVETWNYEKTY